MLMARHRLNEKSSPLPAEILTFGSALRYNIYVLKVLNAMNRTVASMGGRSEPGHGASPDGADAGEDHLGADMSKGVDVYG